MRHIQIIFFSIICLINAYSQSSPFIDQIKIKKIHFGTHSDLTKSFFLNDKKGWIISSKYLFKTNDGGIKWRKISPRLSASEKLVNVTFQDSNVGTLIVQKFLVDLDDNKNYCRILKSTDGGITWKEKRVENDAIVQNLVFTDRENGWVVGYKKQGHVAIGYKYLLLRTRDKGETWEDISYEIETEIFGNKKPSNYAFQNDIILDATVNSQGYIQLLINNLIILTSSNYGDTWGKTQMINKGISYGLFCCSGNMGDGKFWYARTAESSHGIFGEVGIWNGDAEIAWNGIAMNFFEDVLYLKNNEFIAVGRNIQNKSLKKMGIILYTADGGKNWQTIFQDKSISTFNSITKLSDDKLIIVGGNGTVIQITLEK